MCADDAVAAKMPASAPLTHRHGRQRLRPVQDRHRAVAARTRSGRCARRAASRSGCEDDGPARRTSRACASSCSARSAPPARATAPTRPCCSGLEGDEPDTVDVDADRRARSSAIRGDAALQLLGTHAIAFDESSDLRLPPPREAAVPPQRHALHRLRRRRRRACAARSTTRSAAASSSRRGGARRRAQKRIAPDTTVLPLPVPQRRRAARRCAERDGCRIAELMRRNERALAQRRRDRRRPAARSGARCRPASRAACAPTACCPAASRCKRRAPALYRQLTARPEAALRDPLTVLDWVNLYALAVNEENAAGGRVVTAPTNGAAGIIPAVLHYYTRFMPGADDAGRRRLPAHRRRDRHPLQGERLDLAAPRSAARARSASPARWPPAALAAVLGGTPAQVENAAEIGMEHNLGLTCDPIGGLVQIPCIERNAMGAVKAINAARMALRGDGTHNVSPRQGHQDHARDRRRHADQVQGDLARRPRGERHRVLTPAKENRC